MVRDEASGYIIGLGGCRIKQIAAELWPNVHQLSLANRQRGAKARAPRQLSVGGTRDGILAALSKMNDVLPEAEQIPRAAFAMVEALDD